MLNVDWNPDFFIRTPTKLHLLAQILLHFPFPVVSGPSLDLASLTRAVVVVQY